MKKNKRLSILIAALPLAVLLGAKQAAAAAGVCYKLHRLVERRDDGDARAAFQHWNDQTSYVSAENIASIEGIVTPWSWRNQAELFWMFDLKLDGRNLSSALALERNTFPLGPDWDRVWKMRQIFPLDQPVAFSSRIAEREFRITMTWGLEDRPEKCLLPRAAALDLNGGRDGRPGPRPGTFPNRRSY